MFPLTLWVSIYHGSFCHFASSESGSSSTTPESNYGYHQPCSSQPLLPCAGLHLGCDRVPHQGSQTWPKLSASPRAPHTARNAVPTPPPEHATRLTSYVGFFQSRHWNLMNFRRLLSVSQGADTACIVHCGQAEGTGSKAPRDEWDPCPTTCFALKWDRPFLWPEPLSVCQTMLGGGSAPQASGCVPHTAQDTHSSLFGLLADHLLW